MDASEGYPRQRPLQTTYRKTGAIEATPESASLSHAQCIPPNFTPSERVSHVCTLRPCFDDKPLEASPEIERGSRSKKETPTRGRIHPLPTVGPIVV